MLLNGNTLTSLYVSTYAPIFCSLVLKFRMQGNLPQRDRLHETRFSTVDSRSHNDQIRRTNAERLDWSPLNRQGVRPTTSYVVPHLITARRALIARTDAIEEILTTQSPRLTVLRQSLRGLPDLARGLCRIQYGKCTPQELATLLPAFDKLATAFVRLPTSTPFNSPVLNDVVAALPRLREPIKGLLGAVNLKMAKEGRKDAMWSDVEKYPELDEITLVGFGEMGLSIGGGSWDLCRRYKS